MMMRNCLARIIRGQWRNATIWTGASLTAVLAASTLASQPLNVLVRNYHDRPSASSRAAVLSYANAHPKDGSGALALLALGCGEIDDKQYSVAAAHLKAAAQRLPTLRDYTSYLQAATAFESQDFSAVEKHLKPVWDNDPASPLIVKAIALQANAYIQSGDPKKAVHLLEERGSEIAPEKNGLLLAAAYEKAGDAASAGQQFQRVYTEYPLSKEASDAEAALARYGAPSAPALLMRCSKLIDGGAYERARKELEALLLESSGEDRDSARVLIGVTYYLGRDRQKAFSYFKSLDVSNGEPAAKRLYYLVECARRLDRTDEIGAALDELGKKFASSPWRLKALVTAANYYLTQNETAQYEPLYEACYQSFPNEPQAANCQWRVAWAEYLKDRTKADRFTAVLKQFPASSHASAALYYLGRIATGAKDYGAARAYYEAAMREFPNEYYGVLARDRLKESAIAGASPSPETAALLASIAFVKTTPPNMTPSPTTQARIARAKLLASAGLDDLADSELRYGARHDGQPHIDAIGLARLANERNSPDVGIRAVKRYAPEYLSLPVDSTTEPLWRLAFPLPFWKPLTAFAQQRGIDPYMIAGLIRQESEFNPSVVSYANAYGLTQVLPSTGRMLSRQLNIRHFRASMLFTPEVNLNIGTYYLRSVLDQLQGKWEATLASYNAGKSRVVRWLNWSDFQEPAEFVESIPFIQTRDYVKSVMRNADVYRRLYGPNPFALVSTEDVDGAKDGGSTGAKRKSAGSLSQRSHRKLHRVGNS